MQTIAVQFCRRALEGSDALDSRVRAELVEFAAGILRHHSMTLEADAAMRLADDLRNAAASQLHFIELLRAKN